MKYGREKSDLFIVAMRPANKTWVTSSGVGGAKEEDQGEHTRAIHAPDTEPGKRVPGARMCARSCPWASSLVTQGGSPVRESARRDLCGGCSVMGIPTAIGVSPTKVRKVPQD